MTSRYLYYSSFAAALLLIFFIVYWNVLHTNYGYNYDDSKISILLEITEKYGSLTFNEPYNQKYGTYAFIPQGAEITLDRTIFAKGFIGEKINLVLLNLFSPSIAVTFKFSQILFTLLVFLMGFLIMRDLTGNKINSFLASFLATISPVIIVMTNIVYPQMQLLFYGLFTIYAFIKYSVVSKESSIFWGIMLGVFCGITISGSFSYLFFLPAIFFSLLISNWYNKRFLFGKYLIVFLPCILILLSTFWYNLLLFDSPLENYYTSFESPYAHLYGDEGGFRDASLWKSLSTFYLFNPSFFSNHIITLSVFFISFALIGPLAFFAAMSFIKLQESNKRILNILLFIVIPWLLFAGLNDYFGFGDSSNFRPSVWRYLILPIFLMMLFGGYYLTSFVRNKRTSSLVLVILIITSFVVYTGGHYPFNLYLKTSESRITQQERWNGVSDFILANTKESDIIFVGNYDYGFLGLNRRTFNFEYVPEELREEEVNRVVTELLRDGNNVFVYRAEDRKDRLFDNFNKINYQLIPPGDESYEFFRVGLK